MLARRRRELIAEHVLAPRVGPVSDLTEVLGVSDMTIRRDLEALDQAGVLDKVHGGATFPADAAPTTVEPGFVVKSTTQVDEKEAIAAAAAALIRSGTAIGLTAGTTTWHLAARSTRSTTSWSSPTRCASATACSPTERADLTVMLTGGIRHAVGRTGRAARDPVARDPAPRSGVHGRPRDERTGRVHDPEPLGGRDEQGVRRPASAQLVVVADHTKWNTIGLASIVPLDAASAVVTDLGLPAGRATRCGRTSPTTSSCESAVASLERTDGVTHAS